MALIRPDLPEQLFVLSFAPSKTLEELTPEEWDGPFDPQFAVDDEGGVTTFLSDGMPYGIRVVSQEGPLLTLADGMVVRIQPVDA